MKRKTALMVLTSLVLSCAAGIPAMAASWKQEVDGRYWYLKDNGSYPADEICEIDGKKYLFDASGYMLTGWQNFKGHTYSFDETGAMRTGWYLDGNVYYYLNEYSGEMTTGFQDVGNYTYYFNDEGKMQTGVIEVNGLHYRTLDGGQIIKDQKMKINGVYFSFDSNGVTSVYNKDYKKWMTVASNEDQVDEVKYKLEDDLNSGRLNRRQFEDEARRKLTQMDVSTAEINDFIQEVFDSYNWTYVPDQSYYEEMLDTWNSQWED